MDILKIKNEDGTWTGIPVVQGPPGEQGLPGEQGPAGVQGQDGAPGADATINGVNTLTITQGENIIITQDGSNLTISSTASGGGGVGQKTPEKGEIFNIYEGPNANKADYMAHAEGFKTIAQGSYSHAEGYHTWAKSDYSHAEGQATQASGQNSHAEGYSTYTFGTSAHAEGSDTWANRENSHTEGHGTKASSDNQHVQGKYNIEDKANKYAHIVGNGTSSVRSNAHTLDWEGNAWFAGDVRVGGTSYDDATPVATQTFVNDAIATAIGNVLKEAF